MNWFDHHIGDYDKNTSHLTACEDGIYSRLIRRYYDKERPLDADVNEVKRVARARTREEKSAVDSVLREFFSLEADGWHHKTIDEALAIYQAGAPEREAKKKNEDTRLARHREERARLFALINSAGKHLPYNCPMADLRKAAEDVAPGSTATLEPTPKPAPETVPATAPATQTATLPATAPATLATATQPPPTTHHPPDTRNRAMRGSRLPPDWDPGETGRAYASQKGLTNGVAADELERFRDHWAAKTGQDASKADWQAAWRTWVRNAIEFRGSKAPAKGGDPFEGAH